jgi:hypothetical protein
MRNIYGRQHMMMFRKTLLSKNFIFKFIIKNKIKKIAYTLLIPSQKLKKAMWIEKRDIKHLF